MADWATIASVGTAVGTLGLGAATFASVRSANRAARVAERSLQVGLRPVLVPSRPQDPPEPVGWGDGHRTTIEPGRAHAAVEDGKVYLAMALRNGGAGLAVLRGWYFRPERTGDDHADPRDFRSLQRDLYIPAGDTGFWQGAVRDEADDLRDELTQAVRSGYFVVELLYGDQEGGQPTISRFGVLREEDGSWTTSITRHWILGPEHAQFLER